MNVQFVSGHSTMKLIKISILHNVFFKLKSFVYLSYIPLKRIFCLNNIKTFIKNILHKKEINTIKLSSHERFTWSSPKKIDKVQTG